MAGIAGSRGRRLKAEAQSIDLETSSEAPAYESASARPSRREGLEVFLLRQRRAALRLDRAARFLTFFAWLSLVLGLAGTVVAAAMCYAVNRPGLSAIAAAAGLVATMALFVPAYFTPAWARAYAASSLAAAERDLQG